VAPDTIHVVEDSGADGHVEPTFDEVTEALAEHLWRNGAVPPGIAGAIAREHGWTGRLMEVLAVLTEDPARMGYLAGGLRPEEVATWLAPWADSALTVEQIRSIVDCAGWDPDPFVAVARAGLLGRLLYTADGERRRVKGELAGAWLSDEFALSEDDEILREVRALIEADG